MGAQQTWLVLYRTHYLNPTQPHLVWAGLACDAEEAVREFRIAQQGCWGESRITIVRVVPGAGCVTAISACFSSCRAARKSPDLLEAVYREFAEVLGLLPTQHASATALGEIGRVLKGQSWTPLMDRIVGIVGNDLPDTRSPEHADSPAPAVAPPEADASTETEAGPAVVSDQKSRESLRDRNDAKLQALLMDTLTMLRDLKNDWPWCELSTTLEDVVGRAKALGLPVEEIGPL